MIHNNINCNIIPKIKIEGKNMFVVTWCWTPHIAVAYKKGKMIVKRYKRKIYVVYDFSNRLSWSY